jgi:hypothetical protein
MDPVVSGAITAIGLESPAQRESWFALLRTTYSAAGELDWAAFTPKLAESAAAGGIPSSAVGIFVEYLNSYASSPIGVIAELDKLGDDLPNLYSQLTAPAAGGTESGYDETAWNSFLAANGPRWNGDESAWGQFSEWFRYQAVEQGLGAPADQFLAYVVGQADKVAVFGQYGITIARPAPTQPAPAEDPFGWVSQENGAKLAQGWGNDWQTALGSQLDARWGAGWQKNPAEHKTAWLNDLLPELLRAAEPATSQPAAEAESAELSPEELAEIVNAAVAENIQTVPGAEELTEAEIAEIAASVRAEMTGSAT